MRPMSKKNAANNRKAKGGRDAFREQFHVCQCCCRATGTDIHEIARGAARSAAIHRRESWLLVCRQCHDDLDDASQWPVERQLAAKLLADPDYFDPPVVNRLRGRAEDAITLADIVPHLELLRS